MSNPHAKPLSLFGRARRSLETDTRRTDAAVVSYIYMCVCVCVDGQRSALHPWPYVPFVVGALLCEYVCVCVFCLFFNRRCYSSCRLKKRNVFFCGVRCYRLTFVKFLFCFVFVYRVQQTTTRSGGTGQHEP